jgi:hypothetical protein
MDMKDLCARNISAALRDASNAHLAARAGGTEEDLTADLIERACELLGRAQARLATRPAAPLPPDPPAEPVQVVPAVPSGFPEPPYPLGVPG